MPVTQFGIVYGIQSAQIRRYVYPTHDNSEIAAAPLAQGEAVTTCSIGPYPNAAAWQAAVNTAVTNATGKAPTSPRCAVIDSNGNVVGAIMADPAIDTVPNMTLVLSAVAGPGWTWTAGGGFVPPPPGPSGVHPG